MPRKESKKRKSKSPQKTKKLNKKRAEIRQDYIHDRAVVVAPSRGKRPHHFEEDGKPEELHQKTCPFCPDKQKGVKALAKKGRGNNWKIKVVKNIFAAVTLDNPKAYGQQEVVIETPKHDQEMAELPTNHIKDILKIYQKRTVDIAKNKKMHYILIFKNNGGRAGASITHAHSQIFATSFLPPHILSKLTRAQEYNIQMGKCYYCDLTKKAPKTPRFIWEDENISCFNPYASTYNYEAWILPKRHVDNIAHLNEKEIISIAKILKKLLSKLHKHKLPYNYYLHQAIHYDDEHFYLRISPRRNVWAGLELGSRLIVNSMPPEEAAKFYREK